MWFKPIKWGKELIGFVLADKILVYAKIALTTFLSYLIIYQGYKFSNSVNAPICVADGMIFISERSISGIIIVTIFLFFYVSYKEICLRLHMCFEIIQDKVY